MNTYHGLNFSCAFRNLLAKQRFNAISVALMASGNSHSFGRPSLRQLSDYLDDYSPRNLSVHLSDC